MTAAIMAVGCSKPEEPAVPEVKLVGVWKAPFVTCEGMMEDFAGKKLTINADHTGSFHYLSFANWKIEGDQLTFSNYFEQDARRHLELLRYTISNYADTAMLLTGKYMYIVGDSVYQEADMSGLFSRER